MDSTSSILAGSSPPRTQAVIEISDFPAAVRLHWMAVPVMTFCNVIGSSTWRYLILLLFSVSRSNNEFGVALNVAVKSPRATDSTLSTKLLNGYRQSLDLRNFEPENLRSGFFWSLPNVSATAFWLPRL